MNKVKSSHIILTVFIFALTWSTYMLANPSESSQRGWFSLKISVIASTVALIIAIYNFVSKIISKNYADI